jgi:ferredoxin--NADP+ reductase
MRKDMPVRDEPNGLLLEKELIAPKVTRYVIRAPEISRRRRAGQFVIVRMREGGERIPLTIADADAERGSITLVVQEVGRTTGEMAHLMAVGDRFIDVLGPLGMPTHIERYGKVMTVGGGIGVAPVHPIAQAMRAAGNEVVGVLGARSQNLIIMEAEMRRACDRVRIVTDDGSYGDKGFVTDAIRAESEAGKPDLVLAIGPMVMMRAVSKLTKELGIRTMVSLNPVMVDGTGMCGGCRVTVGGKTKFVCVDGPEFDGHEVDFDELMRRQRFYAGDEKASYAAFLEQQEHAPGACRMQRLADEAAKAQQAEGKGGK